MQTVDVLKHMHQYHPDLLVRTGKDGRNAQVRAIAGTDGWVALPNHTVFFNRKTGDSLSVVNFFKNVLGYSDTDARKEYVLAAGLKNDININTNVLPHFEPQKISTVILPDKYSGKYKCVFGYLVSRGISPAIISELVEKGLLYEDIKHNAVFISSTGDYFESRGTQTVYEKTHCKKSDDCADFSEGEYHSCTWCTDCPSFKAKKYRQNQTTAPDRFWFYKPSSTYTKNIYICESAIDAISLYQLLSDKNGCYVSIGGCGKKQAIERIIRLYSDRHIYLCIDNDAAGAACAESFPDVKRKFPNNKDWNEDLVQKNI